jgi:hypothetical protein
MEVHVNYLAVLIAAFANYIFAYIWYAVIFSKLWSNLTGITEMKPNPVKIILVFIGALVMSFVLYHEIVFGDAYTNITGIRGGLMVGVFNWIGFIAPLTLTGVVYEKRSWKLWLLDNMFWFISLLIMGTIESFWI